MPGGTPQSTAQQRVIDPVLTTVARGYSLTGLIADRLFPEVDVPTRGGKLIEFDRTDWKKFNTARAPGGAVKQVQFGHEGKDFALVDHSIAGKVPIEHLQDAAMSPGIDLGQRAVRGAMHILELEKEREAAAIAAKADNYAATNKETLAGNSKWSNDASDPINEVVEATEVVRANTGFRANTLVVSGKVFSRLRRHPKIRAEIRDSKIGIATREDLQLLFDVEMILVGDAVSVKDDGTTEDIWGDIALVAYTRVGSFDSALPTYGYCYRLRGMPAVEMPYFDHACRSWMYPTTKAYANAIVGKDAAYLIQDTL